MGSHKSKQAPQISHPRNQAMEDCLNDCVDCHRTCIETIQHCLQVGGAHANATLVRVLEDCAQICETTADFLIRVSPLHAPVCAVCAQICNACADSCEQFPGDVQMKACADLCRKCAKSCEQMASAP